MSDIFLMTLPVLLPSLNLHKQKHESSMYVWVTWLIISLCIFSCISSLKQIYIVRHDPHDVYTHVKLKPPKISTCKCVIEVQCAGAEPWNLSHLWLAPWLWELWALCTSSSSLDRSSSSCSSVSAECCCLLTRMISCRRASFSRRSCMKSRSRSASARPDQLSLSSCASWCCILCTLRGQKRKRHHPHSPHSPLSQLRSHTSQYHPSFSTYTQCLVFSLSQRRNKPLSTQNNMTGNYHNMLANI